jgi:hypothetical protein
MYGKPDVANAPGAIIDSHGMPSTCLSIPATYAWMIVVAQSTLRFFY